MILAFFFLTQSLWADTYLSQLRIDIQETQPRLIGRARDRVREALAVALSGFQETPSQIQWGEREIHYAWIAQQNLQMALSEMVHNVVIRELTGKVPIRGSVTSLLAQPSGILEIQPGRKENEIRLIARNADLGSLIPEIKSHFIDHVDQELNFSLSSQCALSPVFLDMTTTRNSQGFTEIIKALASLFVENTYHVRNGIHVFEGDCTDRGSRAYYDPPLLLPHSVFIPPKNNSHTALSISLPK